MIALLIAILTVQVVAFLVGWAYLGAIHENIKTALGALSAMYPTDSNDIAREVKHGLAAQIAQDVAYRLTKPFNQ
jgi:hypothetical protein